jgi:hypothetical protein
MKPFQPLVVFCAFLFLSFTGFAQEETFDIVSYTIPKGWQKQQVNGGVQLFITDNKTGVYAIAIVTQSMASTGSAESDFNSQWKSLLVNTVNSITGPVKIEPATDEGWEIHSGNGNYVDRGIKGLATLITATGYDKTVAAVIMTNTQQYQNDLLTFINSLELAKMTTNTTVNNNSVTNNNVNNSSVAGLWVNYNNEVSGYYNGYAQYSGGYMRREYLFNADGTYTFRAKDWMVYVKDILFVYETGTYSINGNQVTLSPKTGRGEWWSKVANNTKAWGKLVSASTDYKLEQTTYTFDFASYSEVTLLLRSARSTQRDGKDGDKTGTQEFKYTTRDINNSLIDNPPGFKNVSENKPNPASVNTINSPLTGRVWEAKTYEKYPGGVMSYHTGGHEVHQYMFNTNGTYRFVYVGASAYTELNILKYESGTYTLNGSQLTLMPTQGNNEEWSVVGGPVKLGGMSETQVQKIKESWNKRIKSTQRKLEKNVYTFRIEYLQGNEVNALILEYNRSTERESNGSVAYYFETSAAKSIVLPKLN